MLIHIYVDTVKTSLKYMSIIYNRMHTITLTTEHIMQCVKSKNNIVFPPHQVLILL